MKEIQDSFIRYWNTTVLPGVAPVAVSFVESIAVVLLLVYLGRRLERSWRSGRLAQRTNVNFSILIGRLTFFAALAVAVAWVTQIAGIQWTGLLAFVGAIGVAVAFAIQDVLKNLVAGLYLLWERPFLVGDLIQVRDFSGRVEDVQIRTTLLRTQNKRVVVVPNAVLFSEIVINRRDETAEEPARLDGATEGSR